MQCKAWMGGLTIHCHQQRALIGPKISKLFILKCSSRTWMSQMHCQTAKSLDPKILIFIKLFSLKCSSRIWVSQMHWGAAKILNWSKNINIDETFHFEMFKSLNSSNALARSREPKLNKKYQYSLNIPFQNVQEFEFLKCIGGSKRKSRLKSLVNISCLRTGA